MTVELSSTQIFLPQKGHITRNLICIPFLFSLEDNLYIVIIQSKNNCLTSKLCFEKLRNKKFRLNIYLCLIKFIYFDNSREKHS